MTEPDLMSLTYAQRKALPPRYHQPHWDGLSYPHSWICEVCWDDGVCHPWPCDVANAWNNGREIAEAGGMGFSW